MARIALILALSIAVVVDTGTTALAKLGPVRAVIDGPGISSPIVLKHDDLADLMESSGLVTGFWRRACKDSGGCISRPDDLGPWYTGDEHAIHEPEGRAVHLSLRFGRSNRVCPSGPATL